jgi:hypothetical protein
MDVKYFLIISLKLDIGRERNCPKKAFLMLVVLIVKEY